MIYDGDCFFCQTWIERWKFYTEGNVEYQSYQQVSQDYPEIPQENFKKSVQLIEPDGNVSDGAKAVCKTLAYSTSKKYWWWLYQNWMLFAWLSEKVYQLVANHRSLFSGLTRLLWGTNTMPSTYVVTTQIFLRFLGVIYGVAFWSLFTQIDGLVGSHGILPIQQWMPKISGIFSCWSLFTQIDGLVGSHGILPIQQWMPKISGIFSWDQFLQWPTLCWWNMSDGFLHFLCISGMIFSFFLFAGIIPVLSLSVLWIFYLSLTTIGLDFLSFQWDILLLETGFLSIFLAPWKIFYLRKYNYEPPRTIVWLLRWLLFRLYFSSGIVKLLSGDMAWKNWTALEYHYQTQPLPTWMGWYMHQLPSWFQKSSVGLMFFVELVCPFFIFFPKRWRFYGFWFLAGFQGLILLTGNYAFFNWLTILLCMLLLDDAVWPKFLNKCFKCDNPRTYLPAFHRKVILKLFFVIMFLISSAHFFYTCHVSISWPRVILKCHEVCSRLNIVNGYGLFAVMTTSRPEIIIEGSDDGVNWKEYEFKYKTGHLDKRPVFVAPHQPRLDWQMWFAALGSYHQNPWFTRLCYKLLQGEPQVLSLLESNPFSDKPPQFIRASVFEYHFANYSEQKKDGVWWKRDWKRYYMPVFSLKDVA